MKKAGIALIAAIPIVLLCRALYLVLSTPADPALLDHAYRSAAYTITWAIQLGYLAWLCLKWRSLKRKSAP
jgi:hypothetical protein